MAKGLATSLAYLGKRERNSKLQSVWISELIKSKRSSPNMEKDDRDYSTTIKTIDHTKVNRLYELVSKTVSFGDVSKMLVISRYKYGTKSLKEDLYGPTGTTDI